MRQLHPIRDIPQNRLHCTNISLFLFQPPDKCPIRSSPSLLFGLAHPPAILTLADKYSSRSRLHLHISRHRAAHGPTPRHLDAIRRRNPVTSSASSSPSLHTSTLASAPFVLHSCLFSPFTNFHASRHGTFGSSLLHLSLTAGLCMSASAKRLDGLVSDGAAPHS